VSDINEAISDIEENKRKIDKLTDKMTESIIEYRNDSLLKPSNEYYGLIRSARNSKTKT
jgi:prefoldin subunit 5